MQKPELYYDPYGYYRTKPAYTQPLDYQYSMPEPFSNKRRLDDQPVNSEDTYYSPEILPPSKYLARNALANNIPPSIHLARKAVSNMHKKIHNYEK
jgi:hypothetical protein